MDGTNYTTTPPPSGTVSSITEELKDSNGKACYLHNTVEKHSNVGSKIMMELFKFARENGGYGQSFRHGKKINFIKKAHQYLFTVQGPCNQ